MSTYMKSSSNLIRRISKNILLVQLIGGLNMVILGIVFGLLKKQSAPQLHKNSFFAPLMVIVFQISLQLIFQGIPCSIPIKNTQLHKKCQKHIIFRVYKIKAIIFLSTIILIFENNYFYQEFNICLIIFSLQGIMDPLYK